MRSEAEHFHRAKRGLQIDRFVVEDNLIVYNFITKTLDYM
nr:MAG TPA: hypothetical protein [Caudoviricetes sp.]